MPPIEPAARGDLAARMTYLLASGALIAIALLGFARCDVTRSLFADGPRPAIVFVLVSAAIIALYRRVAIRRASSVIHMLAGLAAVLVGCVLFLCALVLTDPLTRAQPAADALRALPVVSAVAAVGFAMAFPLTVPLGLLAGLALRKAAVHDEARARRSLAGEPPPPERGDAGPA